MAIFAALHKVKLQEWFQKCQVWLYRGAWQEWEPYMIQMAIPMSPDELLQKRYAIYKHQVRIDDDSFTSFTFIPSLTLLHPVAKGPGPLPRQRRARVLAALRGEEPSDRSGL